MRGWVTARGELLAELRGVGRLAAERAAQLRRLQDEHETALRELDRLRSRNAELDAALSIDLNVAPACGDPQHRSCVPVAQHMELVNKYDQLVTTPRTGGEP